MDGSKVRLSTANRTNLSCPVKSSTTLACSAVLTSIPLIWKKVEKKIMKLMKPQSHMEQSLADRHYSVGPKCQQIPISIVLCSNFLKPVIFEDLHKIESCSIL